MSPMSDVQSKLDRGGTLLAHHWFFEPRGGERVLAELAALFPAAPILTAFAATDVSDWPEEIANLLPRVRPSRLQTLFRASQSVPGLMPLLLPLLPWGMRRSFRDELADADRLLVSDAGLAKTLALETGAPVHVYLHTPMRHIWHDAVGTEARVPSALRPVVRRMLERLRRMDREAAGRVASWAVNSQTTARRASAAYGIAEASFRVIHPPVALPEEPPADGPRAGLLVVSGMQPYKNDRLAVEAARLLDLPLTVVGDGPQRKPLAAMAGPRTRFVGYVDDGRLDALYRSHEALLFCGEEDFGIVPLEAIGRGCPVVALARGGAIETVEAGTSGVFFEDETVDAVIAAIERCRQVSWDRRMMHASVQRFGAKRFRDEITAWMGGTVG
jgi:glycosyltransferase involved in cell wall biosynthesis